MGETGFWDDQKEAQRAIAELKTLRATIDPVLEIEKGLQDAQVGLDLARESSDADLLKETDESLHSLVQKMERCGR